MYHEFATSGDMKARPGLQVRAKLLLLTLGQCGNARKGGGTKLWGGFPRSCLSLDTFKNIWKSEKF